MPGDFVTMRAQLGRNVDQSVEHKTSPHNGWFPWLKQGHDPTCSSGSVGVRWVLLSIWIPFTVEVTGHLCIGFSTSQISHICTVAANISGRLYSSLCGS